jgi:hypothetical protein
MTRLSLFLGAVLETRSSRRLVRGTACWVGLSGLRASARGSVAAARATPAAASSTYSGPRRY